ncbi:hypothetical protein Godav_000627 [Gossypium davidsonii]|uniref:UspA domain-containing protein n=1 Tax=Gossypium davidsonii TaxID=34287 RepID=A0A7J8T1Z5_GOSDV|nr:hypothetical protein [Gossypium davidsonii]
MLPEWKYSCKWKKGKHVAAETYEFVSDDDTENENKPGLVTNQNLVTLLLFHRALIVIFSGSPQNDYFPCNESTTPSSIEAGPSGSTPHFSSDPTHLTTCPVDRYSNRWCPTSHRHHRQLERRERLRRLMVCLELPSSWRRRDTPPRLSDVRLLRSRLGLENKFDLFTTTKANTLAQPLVDAKILFKIHIVKDHDLKERLCLEVERLGLSAVIMGSRGFRAVRKTSKGGNQKKNIVREDAELQPVPKEELEYYDAEEEHRGLS